MDKTQNEKIDTLIKFFKARAVPMTVEDIGSVMNYLETLKVKSEVEEVAPPKGTGHAPVVEDKPKKK